MRIVLLIPTLDRSGAEKQLTLLACGLPRDEFDVHVVALTRGGPLQETLSAAGIPVRVIGKQFKFDPRAAWALRQTLAELQPDILHTWLFAANAYGRIAAGASAKTRVIVSERCVDTWKAGWQFWVDRQLLGKTARIVGNSQPVVDFYRARGVPVEKLCVIPNGIELPPAAAALDRAAIRRELFRVPEDARVIGSVGRLARQKRLEDLVWSAELLQNLRDDAYLVLAGGGEERERIERFARDVRFEALRLLGHRDDVANWLAALDVFWLASDFEGMSNSLMEAMAAGLPVVVSDIPANRVLVEPDVTGLVVPVGDRAARTRLTQQLLNNPDQSARLGGAARARIAADYSVERMVAAYAVLYREVAGR